MMSAIVPKVRTFLFTNFFSPIESLLFDVISRFYKRQDTYKEGFFHLSSNFSDNETSA
jgi:hypothetical protein